MSYTFDTSLPQDGASDPKTTVFCDMVEVTFLYREWKSQSAHDEGARAFRNRPLRIYLRADGFFQMKDIVMDNLGALHRSTWAADPENPDNEIETLTPITEQSELDLLPSAADMLAVNACAQKMVFWSVKEDPRADESTFVSA